VEFVLFSKDDNDEYDDSFFRRYKNENLKKKKRKNKGRFSFYPDV
jgi:hypothetical protein